MKHTMGTTITVMTLLAVGALIPAGPLRGLYAFAVPATFAVLCFSGRLDTVSRPLARAFGWYMLACALNFGLGFSEWHRPIWLQLVTLAALFAAIARLNHVSKRTRATAGATS